MNVKKQIWGNRSNRYFFRFLNLVFILFVYFSPVNSLLAQPEVMAWGNITGIRVEGQLMEFESSLRLVGKGWGTVSATAKERQSPKYDREGKIQTVKTAFQSRSFQRNADGGSGISFTQVVEEKGAGIATVKVETKVNSDTIVEGIFFCIDLPTKYYSSGSIRLLNSAPSSKINLASIVADNNKKPIQVSGKGIIIESAKRQLEVMFDTKARVFIRKESSENSCAVVYIELAGTKLKKGSVLNKTLTLKVTGEIDKSPVEIGIDVNNPGRLYQGLGGNFRLQNAKNDPPVIDYCLKNIRVAWARVEMPWNFWQPEENTDPIEAAKAGNLNPRVKSAMEMAQRLAAIGMPVIISDWSAPNWAIIRNQNDGGNRGGGGRGAPLNPEKLEKIYKSIGDYVVYMKQNFGVEATMFSFNESDIGINVRQTGKEHADFIKGLGVHLASRGLFTKLLLGDNSDATTFDFIIPGMNDPDAYKYIGAISFHSWRGCTDEILAKWAGAAKKMNLPLIVGEGSTDAAAWNYPEIFSEQSFALYEINLYTRICAICQPVSILQWQLTADYSVLIGNGIFGTDGEIRPTQRFWNLKQFASVPENSFAIPVKCNKEEINCAAFGNIAKGKYAVHLVNNGAGRQATINGIPAGISKLDIYITNAAQGMEKTGEVKVENGSARFMLQPASFISLMN